MILANPAIQVTTLDQQAGLPPAPPLQTNSQPIQCPTGAVAEDVTLAPGASGVALAFPTGVTTAAFIFIVAVTTTDLILTVKGTALPPIPVSQGMMLYGLTSAQISMATVLGGKVLCEVGG
jgi:hypothetical protein